ncbi:XdhC family protein [Aquimarina sp. U1-2]|uniref:XdhC family protein n=1 Tax=Aquimarina sp. U1-2 TaxID=2823141 RepID=UPI001AED059F|nr:XdhC/CoxI family protein [Aquimarina sp. U1-2]MBP2833786.1 XdhC family protein [Aquimarina sp. U1-2]
MKVFELQRMIAFYDRCQHVGIPTVMASLVGLRGSSYRKPGVRMLLGENGAMQGALSGGCVEKDIFNAAKTVFKTGVARVISYDGRYRLGCEGFLYILIEPFELKDEHRIIIENTLDSRQSFEIHSIYKPAQDIDGDFGSVFAFAKAKFSTNPNLTTVVSKAEQVFTQRIHPDTQLVIVGAEHDAQKLCEVASFLGWQVTIVASLKNPKDKNDFPKAKTILNETPETIDFSCIDDRTVTVLMTHNFALDFQYLLKLMPFEKNYIGVLGSSKRKAQLENQIFDACPEVEPEFLELIHSPAGLNLGAETPEEIALSIIAEILSNMKKQTQDKNHNTTELQLNEK